VWTFIAGMAVGGLIFGAGYIAGHGVPRLPSHWSGDRHDDREQRDGADLPRPQDPTRTSGRPPRDPGAEAWIGGPAGTGTIDGVVAFQGRVPERKVPPKRRDAEFCKGKEVEYNAVVVEDGGLRDVLVRLSDDAVTDTYQPPAAHAEIEQIDCMYVPRIQGVVAGQLIDIKNGDPTLHNVHTYRGTESWFNTPQIKGSDPVARELPDEPKIVRFTCDVHPWMRGFVVVSPHPFFAVTGQGGAFSIKRVPAGTFTIEAWHSRFGRKTKRVKIVEGQTVAIGFAYTGAESAPPENSDEALF
jgi:hypothetical protein